MCARELPDQLDTPPVIPAQEPHRPAPDQQVALDLPGLLAHHLRVSGDEAVRQTIDTGRTIRRGQGHTVRVTALLTLHRAALEQSAALAADTASPAARKAHRVYAARVAAACT